MRGMITLMIENVTGTISGEAQVHRTGYREDFDVDLVIENSTEVGQALEQDPGIEHYTSRVVSGGMISSSYNVHGGLFYGVDAKREQFVSKVKAAVIRGEYLQGKASELLLGQSMADLLEVDLGDRIVITLSEVETGEMTQALFRISGILHFGMRELDDNVVFININAARKALGLTNEQSHEFVMTFFDPEDAKRSETPIFQRLNTRDLETMGWLDLNKQIGLMIEMSGFTSLITGMVLFLLASLGVINSMFMSIYERIYEFGVIKAIGARPASLQWLILCEAFLLAIVSCILGMLVAYAVGSWTAVNGIPLGEFEFEGIAISNNIMTEFHSNQFTQFPAYVTILTIVAAIYPARFAARIIPSEALQRSL
jgi:ABC-type lipoprotein release transport system permease subunit